MDLEREMMLRLARSEQMRATDVPRVRALAVQADPARLAMLLNGEGLLPLLGGRLASCAGDALPPEFLAAVTASHTRYASTAVALEMIGGRAVHVLRDRGIRVATLKGP